MSGILLPLLIIAFLPYLAKLPLVWAMQRAGGYNNHYPRQQQSQLTGFGQRCTAAHYNSFEALLIYACAVLSAATSAVDMACTWLSLSAANWPEVKPTS